MSPVRERPRPEVLRTGVLPGSGDAHGDEPANRPMTGDEGPSRPAGRTDPRAAALADHLRSHAASFSMSADVTDVDSTAEAGMALLDAAAIADAMLADDARLRTLSEAGLFESMPHGRARFLETPEIRAAIQRPLVSGPRAGAEILAGLVATAARVAGPHEDRQP